MSFSIHCHNIVLKKKQLALRINYHFTREVTLIHGPSGSGKTLFLRTLAGLEQPDSGRLVLQEQIVYEPSVFVPAHYRQVAYAFQDYRLMPHLSVWQNLCFSGAKPTQIKTALTRFKLAHLSQRMPHYLSGGEQQRVSLLRTLLQPAKLYLFDEPVSALDKETRSFWLTALREFRQERQAQFVYVTHHDIETEIWPEAERIDMSDFNAH